MDKSSSYFLKKLVKTVKDFELLRYGDRVVTAVSGGVDSVVLLFSLYELRHYFGIDIACASFNHNIRRDSDEDISFVSDLCKKFSIPFYTESKDVLTYAKNNKLNLEEAARILRYEFLKKSAEDFKGGKLSTAHHLDDFAENFIMRLIAGAGAGAMAGIPAKSGILIRPLINHSKSEILDFAFNNKINFREDCTNKDKRILRNFIRLEIIPKFKERNPSFLKTVSNISEILRKDDDFIYKSALKLFGEMAEIIAGPENGGKEVIFNKNDLLNIEEAILYRLLKISVLKAGEDSDSKDSKDFLAKKTIIYYKHFKAFVSLINSKKPNTYFYINSFVSVRRQYDKVIIKYNKRYNAFKGLPWSITYSYVIEENKNTENFSVKIEEINKTFYIKRLKGEKAENIKKDILERKNSFNPCAETSYFDYDKIKFPITIRPFVNGDRFVPLGMKDNKKLKDYFIDKKIPANIRKTIPLVIFGEKIAWISFNAMSDNIKITKFTKNIGIMGIE